MYLDGELIDAFVRRPPVVIGDGRSTVAGLVCAENANRLQHGSEVSQVLLPFDFDMRRTLAKQSLSLRSVPAAGTIVTLKTVINDNSAADNSTATDLLCDSIIEEGARAVRALGVRFAGIDVITVDPGLPLAETGGVILEANGTPGLYYHYHKRDGAFPAALHVLRRLLVEQPLTPGGPGRARREIHEGARVGAMPEVSAPSDAPGTPHRYRAMSPPLIILGGDANALSVARSLGRSGIDVYAINEPGACAKFSRYCRWLEVPARGPRGFVGAVPSGRRCRTPRRGGRAGLQ